MLDDFYQNHKASIIALFREGDTFPQLREGVQSEALSILKNPTATMQLEVWLLCVEAWSELCVSSFADLPLQGLRTTTKKWCRVERDKLRQLCEKMTIGCDAVVDFGADIRYDCLGRLLQNVFFEREANEIGVARCCDVICRSHNHMGSVIREFQPLVCKPSHIPTRQNYSDIQKRLLNHHALLEFIKVVCDHKPTNDEQKILVHFASSLKAKVGQQQVQMARLKFLATEYAVQGVKNVNMFNPQSVFVFQHLGTFSEFPVLDFDAEISPEMKGFYIKRLLRPLERSKTNRTQSVYLETVKKIGLNNTSMKFLLPHLNVVWNGWWQTFHEASASGFAGFFHKVEINFNFDGFFGQRVDKELHSFYVQVKHVFESLRQLRYSLLQFDVANSVLTWNASQLLNSNPQLYSGLYCLKSTMVTPDDLVQVQASIDALMRFPQLLNLVENIDPSTDRIDVYNIVSIATGVPLDNEAFARLAYWLRDQGRFGIVKTETLDEFAPLRAYWRACSPLRKKVNETIEASYKSEEFKGLVNQQDPSTPFVFGEVEKEVQLALDALNAFPMITNIPHGRARILSRRAIHGAVERFSISEKVVQLLYVVPLQLLRVTIENLQRYRVDSQHSTESSMRVNENFMKVKLFAVQILDQEKLWKMGENLFTALTQWHVHRNLVKTVGNFKTECEDKQPTESRIDLVQNDYWNKERQPPIYEVRNRGRNPENSHAMRDFLQLGFMAGNSMHDEPMILLPFRLALQRIHDQIIPQLISTQQINAVPELGGTPNNIWFTERKVAMKQCDEFIEALHLLSDQYQVLYLQCCFLYSRMLLAEMLTHRKWSSGSNALLKIERTYLQNILWNKEQKNCLYQGSYS